MYMGNKMVVELIKTMTREYISYHLVFYVQDIMLIVVDNVPIVLWAAMIGYPEQAAITLTLYIFYDSNLLVLIHSMVNLVATVFQSAVSQNSFAAIHSTLLTALRLPPLCRQATSIVFQQSA